MLILVQKRLCIFIILFGIAAGYYRHGSMDPAPPNYHSRIERPKPYLQAPMAKWGEEKPPYLPEKHPRSPHWSSSLYGAPGRAPMDMWIRVTLDIIAAVLHILFNFTCLAITFCKVKLPKEFA